MIWLVRTLGTAVIGGVGWKLGNDLYESAKKRFGDKASTVGSAGNPVEAEVVTEGSQGNGDTPKSTID